jgi:hypothetical protein
MRPKARTATSREGDGPAFRTCISFLTVAASRRKVLSGGASCWCGEWAPERSCPAAVPS